MTTPHDETNPALGAAHQEISRGNLAGPPEVFPRPLTGRYRELLPLLSLGGEAFQSFGLEAVERLDELAGARIFGRSGQTQYGIDVYGQRPDGEIGVYQMRCRTETLTAKKLRKAVEDYFNGSRPFDATWFQLCWAGNEIDTKIDNEHERLRQRYPRRHIDVRDQSQFTRDLITHRDLVLRWFGPATADAVYGAHAQAPTYEAAVNADAALRGPLQAFHLQADYDDAIRLKQSDPAQAAERLGEIARKLRTKRFAGHAADLDSERIEMLLAAGRIEDAYAEALASVERTVDHGWNPLSNGNMRTMLTVRTALTGGAVPAPMPLTTGTQTGPTPADPWPPNHPQVQRSFAALRNDTARTEPGEVLDGLIESTAAVVASGDDVQHGALPAMRRLAETALLANDRQALAEAHRLADILLAQMPSPGSIEGEDDLIRLRLVLADATGSHEPLAEEARHGSIPSRLAGVVHARRVRWLTWHAQPNEAHKAWLEAIRAAGAAELWEDAADYLWAIQQLRNAYGAGIDLLGIEYARRARDLPPQGRALFTGSQVETNALRQLRELERASSRYRPSGKEVRRVLRQYLLETTVRGDLVGELQAHRMLLDLHNRLGESGPTLDHAIQAGDTDAAAEAAHQLGQPATHCIDDPPLAPWAAAAALAGYGAVGDLVTVDQLLGHLPWIFQRLSDQPSSGWTNIDIRDGAMTALANAALQVPPGEVAGVQAALTRYLSPDVPQMTMYSAVKTVARMFRQTPDYPRSVG